VIGAAACAGDDEARPSIAKQLADAPEVLAAILLPSHCISAFRGLAEHARRLCGRRVGWLAHHY
jgi:hypothetical protein